LPQAYLVFPLSAFYLRAFGLLFSLGLLLSMGCGGITTTSQNSGPCEPKPEELYCSTVQSVSGGVTVTGLGQYYYRPTVLPSGLTGNPVAGKISYAEVVVKNGAGSIVQCGNTDAQGAFSLTIPKTAGNYTLSINSRADNAHLHVSVLKEICTNQYYSISQSFSLTGSDSTEKNIGTLSAYARQSEDPEIKGGAFNVMKNIYRSNEYIRNTIGDSLWAAPKVTSYWQAGFNPNSYRSPDYANSGISFYSTGNRKLYILGGIAGQTNTHTVDTDHFDDSVIIHEYAHFLEDVYAKQDSPGGSHTGNGIIDARLSWSEGWANFFQAAVLTNWNEATGTYQANANTTRGKYYIDTSGFSEDTVEYGESGQINIAFDLTLAGATAIGEDPVGTAGEGTFREMSVSRELYKAISSSALVTLGADVPFAAIWSAFSSTSQGLGATAAIFRNVGLFNYYLNSIITNSYSANLTKWNSVISGEMQNVTTVDYANPVVASSAACSVPSKTMTPVNDLQACSGSGGTSSLSNKLMSNDFYSYYHDGSNTGITINYSLGGGKSSLADLNLLVYFYDHQYFEECHESLGYQFADFGGAVRSARTYGSGENGTEYVSLAGLPIGYYLVNVRAHTFGQTTMTSRGSTYSMQITTSGTTRNLCPQN
jgi:hypothetical protein